MFPHGVASFDPGPDRVIIWTSVDRACELRWQVSDEGGPVAQGDITAPTAGPIWLDLTGLAPGTDYRYRFAADGHRSPEGRTRTLPTGNVQRWRLAVCCCADRSINTFAAYGCLADEDVDAVLHLGDYIYETAGKGEHRLEPDGTCVTLEDYRARYAQARRDPHLQALHARHPMITVWDDHDVADNAWRHGAKGHDPAEHGEWEDRLAASAAARQEWLPVRQADDDPLRLWRSVDVGDLASLVVTDTRIDGRDRQAGDPGAMALEDPRRSLLGPAQRAWLRSRIADRSATWCLLATQVAFSPMQLPVPGDVTSLDGLPSGYALIDGRGVSTDEWDGYPAERRRVAEWLAGRGSGALVVSGDVHSSWVFGGAATPELPAGAPELVCPPVSSTPMGRQLPSPTRGLLDDAAQDVQGPRWFDLQSWGYLVLDLTRNEVTATFRFVDATDHHARASTGPVFAIDLHPPGRLRSVGPVPEPVDWGSDERTPGVRWAAAAAAASLAVAVAAGSLRWLAQRRSRRLRQLRLRRLRLRRLR